MDDKTFFKRDLISIDDLSIEEINFILKIADEIKSNSERFKNKMNSKIMAPLFFEPSTRTSSSFQSAMLGMGGQAIDFDVASSSMKKGETLRDTIKIINGYHPDIVVMRHNRDGSVKFASDFLDMPIINAGDGQNHHPTQTLLDLFTIKELFGKIEGVKIAIAGDLKYGRTVHSLALALSNFSGCEIFFVSPESLKMPENFLNELEKRKCKFSEHNLDSLGDVLNHIDLVYMTRIQRERFLEGIEGEKEYEKISKEYCLTLKMLENSNGKSNRKIKILHPLPKVSEIEPAVDDSEYAYYFQQAENGLYIRKAIVLLLTGVYGSLNGN